MARHGPLLAAAARGLRPAPRYARALARRRAAIAQVASSVAQPEEGGSDGHDDDDAPPGPAYNLLHLRVERDWLSLCSWWSDQSANRTNCLSGTEEVGQRLQAAGFEKQVRG